MPRTTALSRKVAAAIAAVPLDPTHATDNAAAFGNLPEDVQRGVVEQIALDKAAGLSGNDLRAKYGEGLTGPKRRTLLRGFGFATAQTIARSYSAYRDGEARQGSAHARQHGPNAIERQAAAKKAVQEAAAASKPAARKRSTSKPATARKPAAKRTSGRKPASKRAS